MLRCPAWRHRPRPISRPSSISSGPYGGNWIGFETRTMVENWLSGRRYIKSATETGRDLNSRPQPNNVSPDVGGCLVEKLHDSRPFWRIAERSAGIDAQRRQFTSPYGYD